MCQLLLTFAIVSFFMYHEPTKRFVQQNGYLVWVGFVALMIVMIVLACCGEVRRKSPINLILLGLFTGIQGFVLGCFTSQFNSGEVSLHLQVWKSFKCFWFQGVVGIGDNSCGMFGADFIRLPNQMGFHRHRGNFGCVFRHFTLVRNYRHICQGKKWF